MSISKRLECKPPIRLLPSTLLKLHELLLFIPPGPSRESSEIRITKEKLLHTEGPLFLRDQDEGRDFKVGTPSQKRKNPSKAIPKFPDK